jgi:hypothetical protein
MVKRFRPSESVKKLGFRSKLEVIVNQQLVESGVKFSYEGPLNKIRWTKPATNHVYLADFLLENGIIIEAKGRFTTEDRKKHCWIKRQYPHLDIRFLFSNAYNKLRKGSPTTYAMWCDKNGFIWANRDVPQEWIDYKMPDKERERIIDTLKRMNNHE